jgi:hypothetical protein
VLDHELDQFELRLAGLSGIRIIRIEVKPVHLLGGGVRFDEKPTVYVDGLKEAPSAFENPEKRAATLSGQIGSPAFRNGCHHREELRRLVPLLLSTVDVPMLDDRAP